MLKYKEESAESVHIHVFFNVKEKGMFPPRVEK